MRKEDRMISRKLYAHLVLIVVLLLTAGIVTAQDEEATAEATADGVEIVSPIPGGECTPDTELDSENPIVVGGSLSLTGVFAPTANIHRVVGEVFVDWVNECGGVLGRPVEWVLLDDQSQPDQVTSNYERLITVEDVDLLMGPYAGANILAGAGPAQQNDMVYPTHTNGVPDINLGEFHFPSWQIGNGEDPEVLPPWEPVADLVFNALESTGEPVETVFYLTNKFPTTQNIYDGARAVGGERGFEEVGAVEYDLGTTDFSSIALRIQASDPDFIFMSGIALDGLNLFDAFEAIGYLPRSTFVALPSPGPMMGLGETADGVMSLSIFEENSTLADDPLTQEFIERFQAAAAEEELLTIVETQAAASMSAWQLLFKAVEETQSLEQTVIRDWLSENEFEVVQGMISFDGYNGYGTDHNRIIQIQDGERYLVWPEEVRLEDITVQYPSN
jgi:branched-chain amino acid transport system substrate-binding protein